MKTERRWQPPDGYQSADRHEHFPSWEAFHALWGGVGDEPGDPAGVGGDITYQWDRTDHTFAFWILSHTSLLCALQCPITEADEPAVRDWITEQTEKLKMTRQPLLGGAE